MKKILVILITILFVVGCDKTSSDKTNENVNKEEAMLSLQGYYDLTIEQIESNSVAVVEGESVSGALQAGAFVNNYTGEITKGNIKVTGGSSDEINKNEYVIESNLREPSEELVNYDIIAYKIYNISLENCILDKRTVKCVSEDIHEVELGVSGTDAYSNMKYEGERMEYIIKFDKKNNLDSIKIKSANAILSNSVDNTQYDVVEQMKKFFDEPDVVFFANIPFYGEIYYTNSTITY